MPDQKPTLNQKTPLWLAQKGRKMVTRPQPLPTFEVTNRLPLRATEKLEVVIHSLSQSVKLPGTPIALSQCKMKSQSPNHKPS